jgi:hypothetical protein
MLLMAALLILLNCNGMFRLIGSGAPLAAVVFIVLSFITGYLLGGPERGNVVQLGSLSYVQPGGMG